jgi:hypothetical protein
VLLLPARLKRPREDLLELVAVVHGGMKKDNVGPFFGSTYFILQSGMTILLWRRPIDSCVPTYSPAALASLTVYPAASQLAVFSARVGDATSKNPDEITSPGF